MSEIKTFPFEKDKFDQIKQYRFGDDWPVVYILENGKEMYIGESISVYNRSKQHYENPDRKKLKQIHIITDEEYNKSATLDIESWLIQYVAAEGSIHLQNANGGLKNHSYYERQKYKAKFELIWKKLKVQSVVRKDLLEIKNSDLFKYSPYKALTEDQDTFVKKYDLLIVDEAHRLRQRKNLGLGFGSYDKINKKLGFGKEGTQLDWILSSSKQQVLFYDKNQSVMPSDINSNIFDSLEAVEYDLKTQLRIQAGGEYLTSIEELFDLRRVKNNRFNNYDFKIYDDISKMKQDIESRDKEHGLSRIVAGYAWPWVSNPERSDPKEYDIDIEGTKLVWNSTREDWVNSANALNEVGCIHTVQGYDLNYVGVIIGPELSYDPVAKKMVVDRDKYYDKNGRASIADPEELKQYIINIYKTLLTRGIKGTCVYVVDKDLREYFKNKLN